VAEHDAAAEERSAAPDRTCQTPSPAGLVFIIGSGTGTRFAEIAQNWNNTAGLTFFTVGGLWWGCG